MRTDEMDATVMERREYRGPGRPVKERGEWEATIFHRYRGRESKIVVPVAGAPAGFDRAAGMRALREYMEDWEVPVGDYQFTGMKVHAAGGRV